MSLTRDARQLRAAIGNPACTACPLHENAETVCLTGNGPAPARVAIYGEAPGWNEDQQGEPFVGKAGQFLDGLLADAGIRRSEVFISNVVRCRPPDNRRPTRAEIKACAQYTALELEAVQPEIILSLGNSPLIAFTGKEGITSKRGAAVTLKDGRTLLPTLHPAAVLREPGYAPSLKSDLVALKRLMDGNLDPPETEVHILRTEGEVGDLVATMALLPADTSMSFDVETGSWTGREGAGLEPWADDSKLLTCSFSWKEGESWFVPFEHPEAPWHDSETTLDQMYRGFREALRGKTALGNHNAKFDLEWFRTRGIRVHAKWDSLVLAHMLDENRSNGLKPLSRTFLGAELWEEDLDYDNLHLVPLDQLGVYNGKDTDYTLRLYALFRAEMVKQPRLARIYRDVMMPAVNALTDIELRGFPVNLRRLVRRSDEITARLGQLDAELALYVPPAKLRERNWNRSNFLLWWLFEHLNLPPVKWSPKTNDPSADEDSLLEYLDDHPAIEVLLEWRKWKKWSSTYAVKWRTKIRGYQRPLLYPSYKINGTVTGRLSSNMQQVPRDNYIRSIIGAPRGSKLIDADFSQIELRVAAMVANEPTMLDAYQRGEDLHMLMAMATTGKPREQVTKEERSRAKPVSFGFIYGMGHRKYVPYARAQFGVIVSEDEALHLRNTFFALYPALREWHARMRRIVEAQGYVTSLIGRVRHLPGIYSSDEEVRQESIRQAINSPVQSLASDLTLLAMARIEDRLDPSVSYIVGQIHDSILIEVRDEHAEQTAQVVKEIMETLPTEQLFGWKPIVPIVADVSIHQFYGEALK